MDLSALFRPRPPPAPRLGRHSQGSNAHLHDGLHLLPQARSSTKGNTHVHSLDAGDRAIDLGELNTSLRILAEIFPNVRPEVLREMLSTFSYESRLHVVADQLIQHQTEWVRGRWRAGSLETRSAILKEVFEIQEEQQATRNEVASYDLLPLEESFRSPAYRIASRAALAQEFKGLSRSALDGVLAEQNYAYTASRPVLAGLAAKSWRLNLAAFLTRWRKSEQVRPDAHHMLGWSKPSSSNPHGIPTLRPTGSPELDAELNTTILAPLLSRRRQADDAISFELATLLNEQEAEAVGAVYECECCFTDTTFEAMAFCSEGKHLVCFRCIQRTVSEALFGQSWDLSIDHSRGDIACFAPCDQACTGCIPQTLAQRAVEQGRGGDKIWIKLQERLATEAVQVSKIPTIQCPSCPYVEIDDLFLPPATVRFRLNWTHPTRNVALWTLAVLLSPFILLYHLLSLQISFITLSELHRNATQTIIQQTHRPNRFICRNPACGRHTCRLCRARWRDIHICHENATRSLRTTIEAARTAALKRTCPRCGLGFVKESGCNKMVCVCGYSMCYLCRQGLGQKRPGRGRANRGDAIPAIDLQGVQRNEPGPPGVQDGPAALNRLLLGAVPDAEDLAHDADGEGYRHFCQHFRPIGGRCTECDRCDLYRAEDQDEIVRRAGQQAEREWRRQQGTRAEGVMLNPQPARNDLSSGLRGVQGWLQTWVTAWMLCVCKC